MIALDPFTASSTTTPLPRGYPQMFGESVSSYFVPSRKGGRPGALVIALSSVPLEEQPQWVRQFERELNRLWLLPSGWDGRRAAQITLDAAQGAVSALAAVATFDSPPPQVFPLPDGGVQVEWLIAENSMEIEIEADGSVNVLAMSSIGDVVTEGELASPAGDEVALSARRFLRKLGQIWRSTTIPPA